MEELIITALNELLLITKATNRRIDELIRHMEKIEELLNNSMK